MNDTLFTLLAIAMLLTLVSLLVPAAERLRLPHTVLLASAGLGLGFLGVWLYSRRDLGVMGDAFSGLRLLEGRTDLFLPLFLPPLLFTAGLFIEVRRLFDEIFAVLLLLSAGFGFGEAVVSSSSSAFVADSSEFKTLGAGMGMQGTIGDIGHASGPLLAGILIANMSYAGAFTIIASLQVAAAGVFWLTMRNR